MGGRLCACPNSCAVASSARLFRQRPGKTAVRLEGIEEAPNGTIFFEPPAELAERQCGDDSLLSRTAHMARDAAGPNLTTTKAVAAPGIGRRGHITLAPGPKTSLDLRRFIDCDEGPAPGSGILSSARRTQPGDILFAQFASPQDSAGQNFQTRTADRLCSRLAALSADASSARLLFWRSSGWRRPRQRSRLSWTGSLKVHSKICLLL